jgi:hypothetical protein
MARMKQEIKGQKRGRKVAEKGQKRDSKGGENRQGKGERNRKWAKWEGKEEKRQ